MTGSVRARTAEALRSGLREVLPFAAVRPSLLGVRCARACGGSGS